MKVTVSLFALLLSILFAGVSLGAPQEGETKKPDQKQTQTTKMEMGKHNVLSVNALLGNGVENKQSQSLGEIQNVLFDPQTGQIAFVLLETGGLFSGDVKVIPFKALSVSDGKILLDMDQQKLAGAPSLGKAQTLEEFDRQASEFFGIGPQWVE